MSFVCTIRFPRPSQRSAFVESTRRSPSQRSFAEVDRLLPLSLQDLSLLEVINDVDSFPVDLLSSLPQWLRYRLLNNLPVLDLCRLEHSTVASGINRDELWDTRWRWMLNVEQRKVNKESREPSFQLNVGLPQIRIRSLRSRNSANPTLERLYKEVESELKNGTEGKRLVCARENFLSCLVSRILLSTPHLGFLTSIHGENLPLLNRHQMSTEQRSYIWNKQAIALAKEDKIMIPGEREICHVELLPYRLTALKKKEFSAIEQLSLLANDCDTKPASAYIHVNKMEAKFLHAFVTGRFAQENGSQLSTRSRTCISNMNLVLGRVEILKLKCDNYSNIGVLCSMIEAATSNKDNCQLKCLYCVVPDLYNDVIPLLCSLFSLRHFQHLFLDVEEAYLPSLIKLFCGFMTAPCPHKQYLTIGAKKVAHIEEPPNEVELSTLNIGGATFPQCAAEHKVLRFSSPRQKFTGVLQILLRLPTIRLHDIHLDGDYEYIHLCALHPDLMVTKLTITMSNVGSHAPVTIQEDLVSLLKMPTLREISLNGNWGHDKGVKEGFVQGLLQRAAISLPLTKISLKVESAGCNTSDFQKICDAIFSLPQPDQLEIILGRGFTELNYINVIYESWKEAGVRSWKEAGVGIKLKLLHIGAPQGSEVDTGVLSQFTEQLSFGRL